MKFAWAFALGIATQQQCDSLDWESAATWSWLVAKRETWLAQIGDAELFPNKTPSLP